MGGGPAADHEGMNGEPLSREGLLALLAYSTYDPGGYATDERAYLRGSGLTDDEIDQARRELLDEELIEDMGILRFDGPMGDGAHQITAAGRERAADARGGPRPASSDLAHQAMSYLVWSFEADPDVGTARSLADVIAAVGDPDGDLLRQLGQQGIFFAGEELNSSRLRAGDLSEPVRLAVYLDERTDPGHPSTWTVPEQWRDT